MSSQPWISHPWVSPDDLRESKRKRSFAECYDGISASRTLIAIALICYQTTVIHTRLWSLLSPGSLLHLLFYHTVIYFAVRLNFEAASEGPGFVRRGWMAERKKEVAGRLQFCAVCRGFKPPRSHHCRQCGRCVLKMDHHCPWINTCVGHRNVAPFLKFLVLSIVGSAQSTYVLFKGVQHGISEESYGSLGYYNLIFTIFCFGFSTSVCVLVAFLFQRQLRGLFGNRTYVEVYIEEKALLYREETDAAFVWPYDRGITQNAADVFPEPAGNGFFFPVVDGCDQFALSREQLSQKEIKRRSMKTVTTTMARGSSLDLKELYDRFWLTEGVVEANEGDVWMVTRFTERHLYAQRKDDATVRGWIPRRICALVDE